MLVSDTLILLLTVRRAYIQRRMSPSYGGLLERMVRDGGMYFGIIVFIHLANLLTFYLGDVSTLPTLPNLLYLILILRTCTGLALWFSLLVHDQHIGNPHLQTDTQPP
ncbi:hypothetical protein C8R43DRAFT_969440 [Mycena crocata]|nr:hypothetical protein C8R43DRAFT_969440 [Mycena crocata]